jgi:hypothetical protein
MDRVEQNSKKMSYTLPPGMCKMNPKWPRYGLICGKVKRLLDPGSVPELFEGSIWVEERRQG